MPAITVEDVSKKYVLRHRSPERYSTLRDIVTARAKALGSRLFNPFRPPAASASTREEFYALRGVSFRVERGERIGIIGRNGAGKSTLLKILSRITEPSTGTLTIVGRLASLLEVGTGFHPELTGRENIFLNGAVLGLTRADIKKRFDDIVAFAEVERFLDTPVKRYSSGMYVRLAFAVAANLEPEILVVDEVLAVGDAAFQKKCLGRMEAVGREGRTVLFVSHNMTAVRTLCDRALLLREGTLVAEGPAPDIVAQYLGEVAASVLQQEWPDDRAAPQNSSAALRRVALRDGQGQVLSQIHTDTSFDVVIDFRVKVPGAVVGLTVVLYDNEQNIVFSSINNHESEWYGKPMPVGDYRSCCRLPANFLNNGWFSLAITLFGRGYTDGLLVRDVLRIDVLDSSTVRKDYFGYFGGVVRPLLEWRTAAL
jgi:lipopolysaccharide transport system ATP-binding protein